MSRFALSFGLLGTLLFCLSGCGGSSSASSAATTYAPRIQKITVDVAKVSRQPLLTEIEFTGNLLPRSVTRILPEVEGIVREIPKLGAEINVVVDGKRYSERLSIAYGHQVKQGDMLVQLDTRDAKVTLRISEAKLAKAKADLSKLRSWERPEQIARLTAMRDEAKARYEHAVTIHRRTEALVKRGATTASDFERTTTDVATAKASMDAADATLRQAKAGPTDDEIAVQQALVAQAEAEAEQDRRDLEKATIRAPYDGVITGYHVEVGDRVAPGGNPVVELMDLKYLAAEIAVPESFIGRVQVEDIARVATAGAAEPVPGMVVAINDMVDPQTRTFQMRVAIDNAGRKFKAGQFATVKLSIGSSEAKTLAVPNAAIVFVEGEPHVFTLQEGRVATTRVEVGVANERLTEILAGLKAGDVVVTDDPSLLSDGMKVTVRQNSKGQRQQIGEVDMEGKNAK